MKRDWPCSVYLAGSSRELERVLYYAERLESVGLKITLKWWGHVQANGVGNDGLLEVQDQARFALGDLRAIREADIFWLLWSPQKTGADWEAGYAYALHSRGEGISSFVVSGKGSSTSIFSALAFRDESDAIGLVEVVARAARLQRGDA